MLGRTPISVKVARQLKELGLEAFISDAPPLPAAPSGKRKLSEWLQSWLRTQSSSESVWIHPSDSLWAERPELIAVCEELSLRLIGPSAKTVSVLADRLTWLNQAAASGVSTLVLTVEPMSAVSEIERHVRENTLRFPFVLRSVRAGGRFGCKLVRRVEDLAQDVPLWIEQHRLNLGEVLLFAERWVEGARRISVPFCRFADGRIHVFPETDVSLQSGFERAVSYCPVEAFDSDTLDIARHWSRTLSETLGYVGLGSFDFVLDGSRVFLVDCFSRLMGDFPAWESVAETQAVAWQLATLDVSWSQTPRFSECKTAAVSLSIQAEHPVLHLPQPGQVVQVGERHTWSSGGSSVELILAVEPGSQAKGIIGILLGRAPDIRRATTMLRGVLEETWIAGTLQTNERFLHEVLNHPWVREGVFHNDFLEEEFIPELRPSVSLVRLFAAIASEAAQASGDWIVGDQRCSGTDLPRVLWVSPGLISLPDGRRVRALAVRLMNERWVVRIGLWSLQVRMKPDPSHKNSLMKALVPGEIYSILFREGVEIPSHAHALVIESAGVLVAHALPRNACVERWKVKAGDTVAAGDELAEIAPIG